MSLLGEWLCVRREMQEIPLISRVGNPARKGSGMPMTALPTEDPDSLPPRPRLRSAAVMQQRPAAAAAAAGGGGVQLSVLGAGSGGGGGGGGESGGGGAPTARPSFTAASTRPGLSSLKAASGLSRAASTTTLGGGDAV